MKQDVIGLVLMLVAVLLILWAVSAAPAGAHTTDEIEQWETEWQERFDEVVETAPLSPWAIKELVVERQDFVSRHRCYYQGCEVRSRPSSRQTDRGLGSNVEQWRGVVADFFQPGDVDTALCLMAHESGGNPNAKNPRSSARGLMQILASLWAPHYGVSYEDLYDPSINLSIAADIKAQQGWWAWSPYKRGLCR